MSQACHNRSVSPDADVEMVGVASSVCQNLAAFWIQDTGQERVIVNELYSGIQHEAVQDVHRLVDVVVHGVGRIQVKRLFMAVSSRG
jgi:hypothetical protein